MNILYILTYTFIQHIQYPCILCEDLNIHFEASCYCNHLLQEVPITRDRACFDHSNIILTSKPSCRTRVWTYQICMLNVNIDT